MRKWNLIIDVAKCEDCNNCFLACKDEHVDNQWPGYTQSQPRHGHRWMNIMRAERGVCPTIDVAYRPTPCMHCDDAPCVAKSSGAVRQRPDGIVMIDAVKAAGNKDVAASCPYGTIYWNEEQSVAQKCTFCAHLIDSGWTKPRCVQACPTGALDARLTDDAEMERLAADQQLEVLYPELKTKPRVYYKNLYRFARCFIAGTVAAENKGVIDCAEGARVTLLQNGQKLAEATTDNFGDFRFDRLPKNSAGYIVEVNLEGREPQQVPVAELKTSIVLAAVTFQPQQEGE